MPDHPSDHRPDHRPDHLPVSVPLRTAEVSARREHRFAVTPDAAGAAGIAALLGLLSVERLEFRGTVRPEGRDLVLEGRLEAAVVQASVVSLAAVPLRVGVDVVRRYVADLVLPEGDEVEMPEDDTVEPLPAVIDLGAVMTEALALALPDYPRLPAEELGEVTAAPPGAAPLQAADLSPFAALAGLQVIAGGLAAAQKDGAEDAPPDETAADAAATGAQNDTGPAAPDAAPDAAPGAAPGDPSGGADGEGGD
jgi:uncharacterized metal-binding protein YceD (DUF177 family)